MYTKLKQIGNIKLLSLFNVFSNFRLYSALVIIYFYQITHSYTLALSIFSVVQLSQGLFEIPFGYYSDKYGRSNCLRAGAVASLLSIAFYAIGQNYWFLVIGALFEGISYATFSGNNDALLHESLSESGRKGEYHHEYGKVNSWLELSGFLGIFIGSLLATRSLSLLFTLSIVPRMLAMIISLGFVDPKVTKKTITNVAQHLKGSWQIYKNNRKIRLLSLTDIIGYIGGVTWSFQAAFYNLFLPIWATSMVMSVNFFTSFISFRISGKIIQKYEAMKVLFYSEVYCRVPVLIAFIFPTVSSPFIIAAASSTYGPSVVAKSTILQNELTNEQRATITSINSFVGNIMYSVSAIFVGMAADMFGVAKSLLFVHILLVSTSIIYYRLYRGNTSKKVSLSQ